jgi:threonine dehydrogenase-like Zn-dependent dehydrogenase
VSPKHPVAGIRRRELLGGAALVGAVGAIGLSRVLPRAGEVRVVVFDSERPASRAFAKASAAPRRIDLAEENRTHWRAVRSLKRGEAVAGYTPWHAYVVARGWLEEQGLRLVSETLDRRTGLIAWQMA